MNAKGKILWTYDLSQHTQIGIQGAYLLPVEKFLSHAKTAESNHHFAEIEINPRLPQDSKHFFLVGKKVDINDNGAREIIHERATLLRKFLEKQVDPYRGVSEKNSLCERPDSSALDIREDFDEISFGIQLAASPSLTVDCHGSAGDKISNHRQYLFCKKIQAYFEINYFSPLEPSNVPAGALAKCR